MTILCQDLNFNFPVFVDNVEDIINKNKKPHWELSLDIFTDKFIETLDHINVKLMRAEGFYRKPSNSKTIDIHVDHEFGDKIKLNFIFGGKNSLMQWWKVKDSNQPSRSRKTGLNTYALDFSESDVELLHSQVVKFPSIVQAGIPHNVYNPEEERVCLSLIIRLKPKIEKISMDQACQIFKDFIV